MFLPYAKTTSSTAVELKTHQNWRMMIDERMPGSLDLRIKVEIDTWPWTIEKHVGDETPNMKPNKVIFLKPSMKRLISVFF